MAVRAYFLAAVMIVQKFDYSVRVWDAASGAQLAVLQGHSGTVRCITVSSDGHMAASGSSDGTICVWDLASFSLRQAPRTYVFQCSL